MNKNLIKSLTYALGLTFSQDCMAEVINISCQCKTSKCSDDAHYFKIYEVDGKQRIKLYGSNKDSGIYLSGGGASDDDNKSILDYTEEFIVLYNVVDDEKFVTEIRLDRISGRETVRSWDTVSRITFKEETLSCKKFSESDKAF